MKIIKIFHDGKRIGSIQKMSFLQRCSIRFRRGLMFVAKLNVVAWMIVGSVAYMQATHPKVVLADKEVIVEVKPEAPVLKRIAVCESNNKHHDKNGQVLMRSNTNGTVDVGRYQINSVWFKKASELKLDVTKEGDNQKMAEWIYENRGTGDWYASKDCWSK